MAYIIEEKTPTPEEHYRLRTESGLTPPSKPDIERSLQNTWYGVTVRLDSEAVGMGRIVGDGAIFLFLCDVCVLPGHRGKGLGRRIMQALVEHTDRHAPNSHLSLLADPPGVPLYERVGFETVRETPMVRAPYFKAIRKELGIREFAPSATTPGLEK